MIVTEEEYDEHRHERYDATGRQPPGADTGEEGHDGGEHPKDGEHPPEEDEEHPKQYYVDEFDIRAMDAVVEIVGLQSTPEYNGTLGVIDDIAESDPPDGPPSRWVIHCEYDNDQKTLKPINLRLIEL